MSSVKKYLKISRNSGFIFLLGTSCMIKKKDQDDILLFPYWIPARNLVISTASSNEGNAEEVQPSFWKDSVIVAALLGTLNRLVSLTLCVCRNK